MIGDFEFWTGQINWLAVPAAQARLRRGCPVHPRRAARQVIADLIDRVMERPAGPEAYGEVRLMCWSGGHVNTLRPAPPPTCTGTRTRCCARRSGGRGTPKSLQRDLMDWMASRGAISSRLPRTSRSRTGRMRAITNWRTPTTGPTSPGWSGEAGLRPGQPVPVRAEHPGQRLTGMLRSVAVTARDHPGRAGPAAAAPRRGPDPADVPGPRAEDAEVVGREAGPRAGGGGVVRVAWGDGHQTAPGLNRPVTRSTVSPRYLVAYSRPCPLGAHAVSSTDWVSRSTCSARRRPGWLQRPAPCRPGWSA